MHLETRTETRRSSRVSRIALAAAALLVATPVLAQWPQWGGPNRDFTVTAEDLAGKWPRGGPKQLWHRELGAGYSSIVAAAGVVYTMYRKKPTDDVERTVALRAATGETIWEHPQPAPLPREPDGPWGGLGPNATPLLVGDRLYTVGSLAVMHCFDRHSGKILWQRDLHRDFDARRYEHVGYAISPIAYQGTVIVPVGHNEGDGSGKQPAIVALDQETGEVVWQGHDFQVAESSPTAIRFAGQDQLVFLAPQRLVGIDPQDGALLWSLPYEGPPGAPTPVWNGEDRLFFYAGGGSGVGKGVRLALEDGKTVASEVWSSAKSAFFVGTPVRLGDTLYGGANKFFIAVDLKTGERRWAKRGIKGASCLYADGKLILLTSEGELILATATPRGLAVRSRSKITEEYSLTAPTLVGRTLYVRDRKHIVALDLG
jgi:outer membrane protein assembly factor BamB